MMEGYVLTPSARVEGYRVIAPDLTAIKATGLPERVTGWCCWAAEPREGQPKPAKIPRGRFGEKLKVGEPERWMAFDTASALYHGGGYDGIGLLMASTDERSELTGLDLDRCLEADGSITVGREAVVADFLALGSYVEVSPSGRGLRQFVESVRLEDYRQKTSAHDIEVYSHWDDRYLTLTGRPYPLGSEPRPILDAQAALEEFIRKWCEPMPEPAALEFDPGEFEGVQRTAAEVLKLLRTHNKRGRITRLLAGDCADYDGHSEADMALCVEAAYFSRDPKVIDTVVRGSGLMRDKWDSKRGRETYGTRTIRRALEVQTRLHDADQTEVVERKAGEKARREAARSKAADVLNGGFADLMTAKGAWRQDVWALGELLVRDRRLLGICFYDEFSGFVTFSRSLRDALGDRSAPATVGRMTDDHIRAMQRWFGREWGLNLRLDTVGLAVIGWAQHVRVNPVIERLNELEAQWDGKPRLDGWLTSYCRALVTTPSGVDIREYVAAVGSRWVISAVARGFKPGAKVDTMLALEGRQGARKSSAARDLAEAIGAEYFREGFSLGGDKDSLIALRGRLIVEWGELSGMGKKDREELKTFLSQATDSYRQPFGITEQDWPRTAIFVGTTNENTYLGDPTGNRRFWPVTVGRIDLDRLRANAGQLWGEAVARYKAGERWWFDDHDPRDERLIALATGEQRRRVGGSLWSEVAADLADKLVLGMLAESDTNGMIPAHPAGRFPVQQMRAWLGALIEDGGQITDSNWFRVCEGLKHAGWENRSVNGRMRWCLTDERREELCHIHGVAPAPKMRKKTTATA